MSAPLRMTQEVWVARHNRASYKTFLLTHNTGTAVAVEKKKMWIFRSLFVALFDYCSVQRKPKQKSAKSEARPALHGNLINLDGNGINNNVNKTRLLQKVHMAQGRLPISQHFQKLSQVLTRQKIILKC